MATMVDKARRKQLVADAQHTRPPAGVYRILNTLTGRFLLGSSTNLDAMRNRIDFAQSSGSVDVLDQRLRADAMAAGFDAFTFGVLDTLDVEPDTSAKQISEDVRELEALWRARFDPSLLY